MHFWIFSVRFFYYLACADKLERFDYLEERTMEGASDANVEGAEIIVVDEANAEPNTGK